jgi:hypothetical protein
MHHEISSIEERLARLKDAVVAPIKKVFGGGKPFPGVKHKAEGGGRPFPSPKESAGGDPPFPTKKRKHKSVSAEVKASRQLQGQYISALRNLPKNKRAPFQAMARKEGREKAIAAIRAAAEKTKK